MIATKALTQCSKQTQDRGMTFHIPQLLCLRLLFASQVKSLSTPRRFGTRTWDKNRDSLFFMGEVIVPFTISFTRGPMKINRQCNPAFPLDSQWECSCVQVSLPCAWMLDHSPYTRDFDVVDQLTVLLPVAWCFLLFFC